MAFHPCPLNSLGPGRGDGEGGSDQVDLAGDDAVHHAARRVGLVRVRAPLLVAAPAAMWGEGHT